MMRLLILFFGFFAINICYAVEPTNLSDLKMNIKKYHDSGEYNYDLGLVESQAYDYLDERINENKAEKEKKKLAIVLDIDETSLSNYPLLLKHDFSDGWDDDMKNYHPTGIVPTLRLVKLAHANHVAIFFITGRRENLRKMTVNNLHDIGYQNWTKLYLEPTDYHKASAVPYKSAARKEIEQQGYDIVLNMGDQYSDLKGGHADRTFKLPNPFYYVQ